MNKRIEQLAERCWVHTNEPLFGAKSPHWEFDRQKFAELIVRECAKSANEWYQNHDKIHSDPMSYVLAHFGVEE